MSGKMVSSFFWLGEEWYMHIACQPQETLLDYIASHEIMLPGMLGHISE